MDLLIQSKRFLAGWRGFQERYRVVSKSYSSSISLLELSILIELQLERGRSQAELARLFKVTPQIVFRAAQNLQSLKFVSEFDGADDARIKSLQLTKAGLKELAMIDVEANAILDEMCSDFTSKELARFVKLLSVMEDFFVDERAKVRDFDHPLRGPIRTFTRGFGLLGSSAFGVPSISTIDWHVLTAIEEARTPIYALELAKRFNAPRNSISVLLLRLERKKLLRRLKTKQGDQRLKPLELQEKGKALVQRIEASGTDLISEALKPLDSESVLELCTLLERFVGKDAGEYTISVPVRVKPLRSNLGAETGIGIYLANRLIGEMKRGVHPVTAQEIVELLTHKTRL